jgi:hypothetical protein
MGWAFGVNREGREVGYGVLATCDQDGCNARIDRGLGCVCGGMHDGDEHGCGRYFCGEHLLYTYWGEEEIPSPQLCAECADAFEALEDRPSPPEWWEPDCPLSPHSEGSS